MDLQGAAKNVTGRRYSPNGQAAAAAGGGSVAAILIWLLTDEFGIEIPNYIVANITALVASLSTYAKRVTSGAS